MSGHDAAVALACALVAFLLWLFVTEMGRMVLFHLAAQGGG